MRRVSFLSSAGVATLGVAATVALAAPGDLAHPCSFRYGVGDYQNVSYSGRTSCSGARAVIKAATNDGRRKPKLGTRTVRQPHDTWRCTTVRDRHVTLIVQTHRIDCRVQTRAAAHVRFRYGS